MRRQVSNLVQIYEDLEGEAEKDEIYSFSGESPQSIALILSEVRATMAVGAELNVKFRPDDELILRKMILLENKEADSLREKTRGRGRSE